MGVRKMEQTDAYYCRIVFLLHCWYHHEKQSEKREVLRNCEIDKQIVKYREEGMVRVFPKNATESRFYQFMKSLSNE